MSDFDSSGRRINVVASQETADWLLEKVRPNVAATFTLLQWRSEHEGSVKHWVRGNQFCYERSFVSLVHDLSRSHYGKAYRRFGKQVPHFATLEGEGDAKRFHIHAGFRCPEHVQFEDFVRSINLYWQKSPWWMNDVKIEVITGGWTRYCSKEGSEALLSAGGF